MPSLLAKRPRSCERLALHGKEAAPQHKTSMVLVHVKYGEASMAPAVFNPDCDSATLLDYVRRRAVKDTEAYARQADARVSAFVGEVANDLDLARARASFDRINRGLEGEVAAEDEAAVAERAEATAAAEAAAAKVARLEELEKGRTAQKDALINGVGLFKGLDGVDLQEEGGAALNLRSDPKRNAKDVLGHRKTYVVVRVGEPPKPPREPADGEEGEEGEEPEPEAGPDPDALVPLTFELPPDPVEPVEEPAAEPAAEEGAE